MQYCRLCISCILEMARPAVAMTILLGFVFPIASAKAEESLIVETGKAVQLVVPKATESIFIADPEIADISSSPAQAQYVYGKKPGETTIIATDVTGKMLFSIDVVVVQNLADVQRALRQRYPSQSISLSSAAGSILVTGSVKNELIHQNVLATIRSGVPDSAVIDQIIVKESGLIRLDVKLIELSSSDAITSLGSGLSFSGQNADKLNDIVNRLRARGEARIVATTTLTTMDGKKAEFSTGSEVDFSSQANAGPAPDRSLQFVGIHVSFLPKLLPSGRVFLEVTSGFSAPPSELPVKDNSAPDIMPRRFTSSVELSNNESMAVATMMLNDQRRFMAIVTPHLGARAVASGFTAIRRPLTNLEYVLTQKLPRSQAAPIRIYGSAGFLY